MALKDLGREKTAKALKLPKRPEPRVVTYSHEDVSRILQDCRTVRDRLLVSILAETGARRGELYNMRLRDVEFDEHSAIITLHGKTGTRKRRIWNDLTMLRDYILSHPDGANPEAKFWLNQYGTALAVNGIYKIVRRVGRHALGRNMFPHGFRHSAATRDLKSYTDREVMIRHGWKRPDMIEVYGHLTGRDVDEKDLALHGIKERGMSKLCPKCRRENAQQAKFCQHCGQALPQDE